MVCPVIIYSKPSTQRSWDFHGRKGFSIGPTLNHYLCFHVTDATTKSLLYSDTVEFMHDYLTQPIVSYSDRIVHALNFLSCAVKYATAGLYHNQLTAISNLRDLFFGWNPQQPAPMPNLATPLLLSGALSQHPQPPVALPSPPPPRPPPRLATPTATPLPPPSPSVNTPLPLLAPRRAPSSDLMIWVHYICKSDQFPCPWCQLVL